jgi:hypothetical protein
MLIPLRFNDGQPVPNELIADTLLELEHQFGAVSCESQQIQGRWRHQDHTYRDELVRVFVDVPDDSRHREFFTRYKESLKGRFQQIDNWMTTYPIDVL